MADYYGLEAIAQRMAVGVDTIIAWKKAREFLMYRRRQPGRCTHSVWYTNDLLILCWERAQALGQQIKVIRYPKTRPRRYASQDGPTDLVRPSAARDQAADLVDAVALDAVSTGT